MNQLVYVHGVNGPRSNNEDDSDYIAYKDALAARNMRFEQLTFVSPVTIHAPLWSVFAAHPAWGLACVPDSVLKTERVELGGIGGLVDANQPIEETSLDGCELAEAAMRDLDAVVGSLSSIALEDAEGGDRPKRTMDFWEAAAKALDDSVARQNLLSARDDAEFVDRLQVAAHHYLKARTLSIGDDIRKVAVKLKGATRDIVNSPVLLAVRSKLTPAVAMFIGDVFTYLKDGPARDKIRAELRHALLEAARAADKDGGRLVVLGHSMGGVILYDLFSDQAFVQGLTKDLGKAFRVDLMLTVGSQVALFEELKVFTSSDPTITAAEGKQMSIPIEVVNRWWNVYNRLDALSFLAKPVFLGVEDFEINTTAGIVDAHGAYFTNTVFYTRLKGRMFKEGLLP